MRPMTRRERRERRAERQRQYLMKRATPWASPDYQGSAESGALGKVDYETPLPGWLRPLDYKVSSETGALKVPSRMRTWHLGGRANGHAPPPGQGWDRSGATYVTGYAGAKLPRPIIHHEWRRLTAEQMAHSTTT